jgi:hypothetical protein
MIRKSTVLIIGAGGSIPYKLPSGAELLGRVIGDLSNAPLYSAIYRLTGQNQTHVEAIRKRLTKAMTDSIDAFLEKNPDDPFVQDLGKISIAYCLWPLLQRARAYVALPEEDWISFVWNRMHQEARSFKDLRQNKLTFITFNFDTLLEAKLVQAIGALYPRVSKPDAQAYVESIALHVHGTLSQPPKTGEPPDDWLKQAKDDIRVVHQEIDKALLSSLSKLIDDAEIVAFLGFGYHPDNLKKLGFPRNDKPGLFGSAFGLGLGEKAHVTRSVGTYHGRLPLGEWDQGCKAFLQNHDVLRS